MCVCVCVGVNGPPASQQLSTQLWAFYPSLYSPHRPPMTPVAFLTQPLTSASNRLFDSLKDTASKTQPHSQPLSRFTAPQNQTQPLPQVLPHLPASQTKTQPLTQGLPHFPALQIKPQPQTSPVTSPSRVLDVPRRPHRGFLLLRCQIIEQHVINNSYAGFHAQLITQFKAPIFEIYYAGVLTWDG